MNVYSVIVAVHGNARNYWPEGRWLRGDLSRCLCLPRVKLCGLLGLLVLGTTGWYAFAFGGASFDLDATAIESLGEIHLLLMVTVAMMLVMVVFLSSAGQLLIMLHIVLYLAQRKGRAWLVLRDKVFLEEELLIIARVALSLQFESVGCLLLVVSDASVVETCRS